MQEQVVKPKKLAIGREGSFAIAVLLYGVAAIAALLVWRAFLPRGMLEASLLGDVAATVVVWAFGVLARNSSVYDPYWSVAPLVLFPGWLAAGKGPLGPLEYLLLAAILFWGVRLTVNWAVRWRGLGQEDWRYAMLRRQQPRLWFLINLLGINLMPTALVFFAMVPAYCIAFYGGRLTLLSCTGTAVCFAAVAVELFADGQMERYKKKTDRPDCIDEGLWRYSRHPNYFGEVLFWWGVWLAQLGALPALWVTVAAPFLMTLLFLFVSIPMMERHMQQARPAYSDYRRRVSKLVPFFRRRV